MPKKPMVAPKARPKNISESISVNSDRSRIYIIGYYILKSSKMQPPFAVFLCAYCIITLILTVTSKIIHIFVARLLKKYFFFINCTFDGFVSYICTAININ